MSSQQTPTDARARDAEVMAASINQEQLFHELEQKYIEVKSELAIVDAEKQEAVREKHAAQEELKRLQTQSTEREADFASARETLLRVTSEKDQLGFQLKTALSLAERRFTDIESLQATVKEQAKQLVDSQRREMDALQQAAEQEAQVEPLRHAMARLHTEIASSKQHSEWLESQVTEKTKFTQELRQSLSKQTHDYEELKMKYTEELTSTKRQLENARQVSKKLESSLIQSKEQVKEIQAAKAHEEERFQHELSAQRRLAELYKESASDANARVTELQELSDSLRHSLAESEEALSLETERTKAQVEHLFREQSEASEKIIATLQQQLQDAKAKIDELERKKIFSLQTASSVADLSSAAGEAHLAAHGLSPKQMYDHIVDLEETLRDERTEKEKLQLYMDRIVKEVQEKAPIIMGLRLDHERAVASHAQMTERLEVCMQELTKSKSKEAHAWKEKRAFEKKCESLAQNVDDLSRQVQHLLFRSQENRVERIGGTASGVAPGDVVSENLVVFRDVEELQARNQQLLTVIRELSEIAKHKDSMVALPSDGTGGRSTHFIVSADSDDEGSGERMSSADINDRLSQARQEVQELRAEREQERQMIAAIVKQRDMYRVLLAQSDNKFLDSSSSGSGASGSAHESTTRDSAPRSSANRRASFDVTESRALRDLQNEFEDYKKEKQTNTKLLQESLDQLRAESSQARLAQMQAEVEAKCTKERYEASEARRHDVEDEVVRLRSKTDQLSSLLLHQQQLLADSEAKLDAAISNAHSLGIEKESASRDAEYLKKHEEKLQQELTSLRLDNTNLLKLMESTRRMESAREERDRRESETLAQKVGTLESRLQDAYAKNEAREALAGANLLAAEQEKKAALTELEKLKKLHGEVNEKLVRLEEQKAAADSKTMLLEKEVTHLREQLRKGANAAAAERVAALEVQLRDAQREVQSSLALRKSLTENVARYKAIAEANEKSLTELSSASEKWKESQELKLQALEKERDHFQEELAKARSQVKEHIAEVNKLRNEIDRVEEDHKVSLHAALEKQSLVLIQAEGSLQEIASLREEITLLKKDLSSTQENYERELQLHAAEVSKAAASRKLIEEEQKKKQELVSEVLDLKTRLATIDKEAHDQLENLRKELAEVTEAKDSLSQQNKLLHSQLERASSQVRRAHEQELMKNVLEKRQPVSSTGDEEGKESGGATIAVAQHDKEVDDLRSVMAFLRRENEISTSKLDLAQQEVQRYRAQVLGLESTVERLRDEIKAFASSSSANNRPTGGNAPSDNNTVSEAAKRFAQLEQLSLLRESNATLRDESQKNLAKLKEEEAKVVALEAQLAPLRASEASLKTQVASLKQEIVTLNDANKRWKQRVEQLVEKYQQIDPAEHDKVVAEREALVKEVAELKTNHATLQTEVETLRSSEGKSLEEEKQKVENWRKQYDRIKGFAKTWKTKAENLGKQLAEKTKELDDKSALLTELETKIKALEGEKANLEAKVVTAESFKQDSGDAAANASVQFDKERQEMKERFEAEQKKNNQLKDFNARLMSGLKALKKENTELKGQAASAASSPAPEQTAPTKDDETVTADSSPTPAVSSFTAPPAPTPVAPVPTQSPTLKPIAPVQPPLPPTTSVATTVAAAAPKPVATSVPAVAAPPAPPAPTTTTEPTSSVVTAKPVVLSPAAPAFTPVTSVGSTTSTTTAAPVVSTTTSTNPGFAMLKVVNSAFNNNASSGSTTTTTTTNPTSSTSAATSSNAEAPALSKPVDAKETPAPTTLTPAAPAAAGPPAPTTGAPAVSAEDKLRLFALQSMRKQVMSAKPAAPAPQPPSAVASSGFAGTPTKLSLNNSSISATNSSTATATTPAKLFLPKPAAPSTTSGGASEEDALKAQLASSGPFLKMSPPTGSFGAFGSGGAFGGGAFGSGGAGGLVFGKPGITLPIPASPTPVNLPPTPATSGISTATTAAAPAPVASPDAAATPAVPVETEAQRRSQRLARFAAQKAAAGAAAPPLPPTSPQLGPSGNLVKRPASGSIDVATPQKIAKISDEGASAPAVGAEQESKREDEGETEDEIEELSESQTQSESQ